MAPVCFDLERSETSRPVFVLHTATAIALDVIRVVNSTQDNLAAKGKT